MKVSIINILKNTQLTYEELIDKLHIKSQKDFQIFNRIMSKLQKQNIIIQKDNKFFVLLNPLEKIGIFFLTKDNEYGFIDTKEESYIVFFRNFCNAMTGDVVKFTVIKKNSGFKKSEAKILEVVDKKLNNVIGEIYLDNKQKKFKPYSKLLYNYILEKNDDFEVSIGDVIICSITKIEGKEIFIKPFKKVGQSGDNDIDIQHVLVDNNIPISFSKESLNYAKNLKVNLDYEKKYRTDLTKELIVTIDGIDAKDLDDAISIKKINNNLYKLSVHIADVSYFVKKNTPLDSDAYNRGTSVYLINTVIPMLPEEISNNLCSLNENGTKLTITCDMWIDEKGQVKDSKVYPSFIKNKARLTYDLVNNFFKKGKSINKNPKIDNMLKEGLELSKILRRKKLDEGMIDFKLYELKLKLDADNKVIEIKKSNQDVAENLIEDFMVVANETISLKFLHDKIPFIYRVHNKPPLENLNNFSQMLKQFKVSVNGNLGNPKNIQTIIDKVDKLEYGFIIKKLSIQTMAKAKYDFKNIGHYGLGLKSYTHFTSPIRRYPDLIVHRLLRHHYFLKNNYPLHDNLSEIGIYSSYTEKRAQDAERQIIDKKLASYMTKYVGQEFDGFISSIQKWGFFVQLENGVEGLVSIKTFPENSLKFNIEKKSLTFKKENEKIIVFLIGKKVRVKLLKVDGIKGIIDFEFLQK